MVILHLKVFQLGRLVIVCHLRLRVAFAPQHVHNYLALHDSDYLCFRDVEHKEEGLELERRPNWTSPPGQASANNWTCSS